MLTIKTSVTNIHVIEYIILTSEKLIEAGMEAAIGCSSHGSNSSASDGIADDFSIDEDDDMSDIYREEYEKYNY